MDKNLIDVEIEHVLNRMSRMDPGTKEYVKAAMNLKTLIETRNKIGFNVDWNVVINAGTTILLTIFVLNHERMNVISTRTFSWIRPK